MTVAERATETAELAVKVEEAQRAMLAALHDGTDSDPLDASTLMDACGDARSTVKAIALWNLIAAGKIVMTDEGQVRLAAPESVG